MDVGTKKAIYINLFLLAAADGTIDPAERAYLEKFARAVDISDEQAGAWRSEVEAGQIHFRPIADPRALEGALAVMARMIRIDGQFSEEEQNGYVSMGKALGLDEEQLGQALRKFWDKDPLETRTTRGQVQAHGGGEVTLLIIEDDIAERNKLDKACADLSTGYFAMGDLHAIPEAISPRFVMFHAAEDRRESLSRLETLSEKFPEVPVTFIARQDQAPQIGYLLERGAKRCFVEPLYPDEVARGIKKLFA